MEWRPEILRAANMWKGSESVGGRILLSFSEPFSPGPPEIAKVCS